MPHEVAPAELYEVYQGPHVKPLKVIRIRQYRKAGDTLGIFESWGTFRYQKMSQDQDLLQSTDHLLDKSLQTSETCLYPGVKVPDLRHDWECTVLSETLAEIVKERKAEEMKDALKAKIYEKDMMAKNVGSKAAEVVKSMDVDLSRLDKQRQTMHQFISSSFFDSFIGLIILVNAVIIGYEAELSVQIPFGCDEQCKCDQATSTGNCFAMPQWLQAVDYVFAAVYIAEFCLRLYTYGIPVLRTLDMYSVK
ncbi:unnamed protein product [Cladocopium goreaui]|uniref:Voltage-dependent calcium channel type A subunit alpha-1 n=1 Tax=Cladocopium goreaui TaxID=2562237 RepID=A0A9P1GI35_9DINO|nr:unnamed protein product [Cladocopium goreaui]